MLHNNAPIIQHQQQVHADLMMLRAMHQGSLPRTASAAGSTIQKHSAAIGTLKGSRYYKPLVFACSCSCRHLTPSHPQNIHSIAQHPKYAQYSRRPPH